MDFGSHNNIKVNVNFSSQKNVTKMWFRWLTITRPRGQPSWELGQHTRYHGVLENSKIIGYGRWTNISSIVKTFRKIFGIDWLCLGFATDTNRTKKENTDDL